MEPIEIVALVFVIGFVISVNLVLIRAARGKITLPEVEFFRRVTQRARDPWKFENEDLQELSRRVSKLKEQRKEVQSCSGSNKKDNEVTHR